MELANDGHNLRSKIASIHDKLYRSRVATNLPELLLLFVIVDLQEVVESGREQVRPKLFPSETIPVNIHADEAL